MCIGTLFYLFIDLFLFLLSWSCPELFSSAELALSDLKIMFILDNILWYMSFSAISLIRRRIRNFWFLKNGFPLHIEEIIIILLSFFLNPHPRVFSIDLFFIFTLFFPLLFRDSGREGERERGGKGGSEGREGGKLLWAKNRKVKVKFVIREENFQGLQGRHSSSRTPEVPRCTV